MEVVTIVRCSTLYREEPVNVASYTLFAARSFGCVIPRIKPDKSKPLSAPVKLSDDDELVDFLLSIFPRFLRQCCGSARSVCLCIYIAVVL